jgi:hypothetical protein
MKRITNKYLAKAIILGVGVLSAASLTASAQVLFTTQNDFAGWNGGGVVGPVATPDADGSTINGLGNTTAPGGTGTAGSLSVFNATTGWNTPQSQDEQNNAGFLAALKANTLLTLTYTLTSDIQTGANGYWQLIPVFNWTGGYNQVHNDSFFAGANLTAGTHTVTYDYSSYQAGLPTSAPGYFQLVVVANSGGSLTGGYQQWYLDNIQVSTVPEPTSFALAGLGAAALLIFRRRK